MFTHPLPIPHPISSNRCTFVHSTPHLFTYYLSTPHMFTHHMATIFPLFAYYRFSHLFSAIPPLYNHEFTNLVAVPVY
jgi:hypothetical protein